MHTFSLTATAKLGPDTNFHRFVLTAARFWPQRWLAVGINGSWKRWFLAWLFSWMIRRRRREGSILLPFLLFYGLMVGKYALICAMEIQKIHMVVHIFYGFALFTELMWVYRGVESLCKLLTDNKVPFDQFTDKRVQIQILSILKLVSFESLAGNDFSEWGTQAEAHCKENLNRQLWSIRRKISHRCSRNFCKHFYKSWWR